MATPQLKTARYLIIQALAVHGPLTSEELAEKVPSLTAKQIKDNVAAAKAPGYIKSQLCPDAGKPVHQITPAGNGWYKANKAAVGEKSTTSSEEATDKPGVSATTPEAAVHKAHPLPTAAAVRPENAPVEATQAASAGGDGGVKSPLAEPWRTIMEITKIADPFMQFDDRPVTGVKTMDMLIEAQGTYIDLLEHMIEYRDRVIEEKDKQLDRLKLELATCEHFQQPKTPAIEQPHDATSGPYIIASGWQIIDGLEAANEAAIQKALSSVTGKVVIARPVQVAEVAVQIKEYPQCAAATAPLSN